MYIYFFTCNVFLHRLYLCIVCNFKNDLYLSAGLFMIFILDKTVSIDMVTYTSRATTCKYSSID